MKKTKVAVFPAGTEIGLEVAAALKHNKHFELIGLTSVKDHSKYVYKNLFNICDVSSPDFLQQLNDFIYKEKIDVFYPAHDLVLDFVAENFDKINCKIVMHPQETIKTCRNKETIYKLFSEISPKIIEEDEDCSIDVLLSTLFAKPKNGFGGKGSFRVHGPSELFEAFSSGLLVCEYLPGDEFTVDCFTDLNGELKVINPRTRARVRNGIAVKSEIVTYPMPAFWTMAELINNKINFCGGWFFQVKKDRFGFLKLLEVAPRIAGTSGLTRANGANLPLLSIYNALGINCKTDEGTFITEVDRALVSKYTLDYEYDTVYVDYDDTLIVNGKANAELMHFLYQCKNEDKNICIITRNMGLLLDHRIDMNLFNNIIRVPRYHNKSEFMNVRSIFIDDSFKERKEVSDRLGIPVFDVSEVSCLIK